MTDPDGRMSYECVDPDLGAQLWQRDLPGVDAELQSRLSEHLRICARCRMEVRLDHELSRMVRADGEAVVGRPRRRWWWSVMPLAAALGLAVCLAAVFLAPPVDPAAHRVVRAGGDVPAILRPVAGEVVVDRTPRLTWTAVARASRYRVTVRELDGAYAWSEESRTNAIEIPATAPLPARATMQVLVEVIPEHLTPPAGLATSFRTGSRVEYLTYRVTVAPAWAIVLGAVAVGMLAGWFAVHRRGGRRTAHRRVH